MATGLGAPPTACRGSEGMSVAQQLGGSALWLRLGTSKTAALFFWLSWHWARSHPNLILFCSAVWRVNDRKANWAQVSWLLPYPVFILLCPHGNTLRLSRFCWIKPLLVHNCKTGRTENKPFSHGERQEDKKGNSAYHSIPRPGHSHATLTHSSRYKSSVLNQLDTSIGFLKIKFYYLFFFSTTINNS